MSSNQINTIFEFITMAQLFKINNIVRQQDVEIARQCWR